MQTKDLKKTARIGGILYLIIIVSGIFAEFFARMPVKAAGDAAATAQNILANDSLFRLGITADLFMIVADVGLAIAFYVLLRGVNRSISLLAAFFRLAQAAVLGFNLLNLLFVLELVNGSSSYLAVLGEEQRHALALFFLEGHGSGYALALVFFGLSCLVLAYLVVRSGYLPKILGLFLAFAGLSYLADMFARVLMADYAIYAGAFTEAVFLVAFAGELAVMLYLLLKGVRDQPRSVAVAAAVPTPESL